MRAVKVLLKDAENVKQMLIQQDMLHKEYKPGHDHAHVYFPLAGDADTSMIKNIEIVEKRLKRKEGEQSLKEMLVNEMSGEEIELVPRSFDVIGEIAIIDVAKELEAHQQKIAEALMKVNKHIKTVLKKADIHSGEFRTQPLEYVAGKDTRETIHAENGVRVKLDVERVYFSPRLSTERKRIASLVKPGERVLVMFSGCGIYPLVIWKNAAPAEIVGIEKNPVAHRYAEENVRLNKATHIGVMEGDVKDKVGELGCAFDRIIMPLPKQAHTFLEQAFEVSKEGTIIHLYLFLDKWRFEEGEQRIKRICNAHKKRCKILNSVACGQYSPSTFRVCIDFQII